MRRRALLGLLGAGTAGLAGCTGIFGDTEETGPRADETPVPPKAQKSEKRGETDATPPADRPQTALPADCSVSTVPEVPPPDQPTPKTVESFVRTYEEAYMLQEQFLSYEDELTAATILSLEQTGYGYATTAQFSGADTSLQASISARPVESPADTAPLSVVDSDALVDIARRAAARDQAAVERLAPPSGETAAETRPDRLQGQVDELPGSGGGYVSVDGQAVRLRVDVREVHADYFTYSVLYYVDSSVVRRTYLPAKDASPRDGPVVECR